MQQSHSVTTTILQNTINMIIIILIMLLPIIDTAIPSTIVDKPYWISIELKSIDWRLGGCLNTGGCAQPRLNIVLSSDKDEMMSISWPINTHDIVQNARPFITHWTTGKSTDIALICEIVGIDPIYAFPRICDTTTKQQFVDDSSIKHSTTDNTVTDQQSTITIRGKCFNVTLIIQLYNEHCPWCNHHYRSTSDDNLLVDFDNSSLLNRFINRFNLSRIIIIITFAIVFVLITTALIITIIAYCRQKKYYSRQLQQSKSNRTTTTINRYHQDHQVRLHHHHQLVDDEIKYDIPWQQQSLPDWLVKSTEINANNNHNSSMSRTLINGQHRYSLSSNNSRNNHQQSSPNNSTTLIDKFDGQHDDSGLESV